MLSGKFSRSFYIRILRVLIFIRTIELKGSFFKRKDGRIFGYKKGYLPVCTHGVLLRTRNSLPVLTISPRFCRALRPTPCPHSTCNAYVERCIAKARWSWGLSAYLSPGCQVGELGARGRPAEPDGVA